MHIQHTVNGRAYVIDAQMLDYLVIAAEALANIVQAQPATAPATTPPAAPVVPPRRRLANVPPGFLTREGVLPLVPFGTAELSRRSRSGMFPAPVRRGVWSRADVEAWCAGTWKPAK